MQFNSTFKNTYFFWFLISLFLVSCQSQEKKEKKKEVRDKIDKQKALIVGANKFDAYLPFLKNKNFAVVANQTSVINFEGQQVHLIDYLKPKFKNFKLVFAPEHGFRGKADAGEHIKNGIDHKTGLSIISLYGKNKKPSEKQLKGIDIVLFDIQDVGVRFYTYISTLHYVMEACAANNIKLIVLDRPNPNVHYVDGPMLETEHKSFVGMHSVPLVYGMTIGEYAKMINGERWLSNNLQCDLTVIALENYTYKTVYDLPIKPSPNLPNAQAINLYPSLAFFEGTNVSCGRGTEMQFQIFGSPFLPKEPFSFEFTPKPNFGAKYPKHKGKICNGLDLRHIPKYNSLNLEWLIGAYTHTKNKKDFFNPFFTKLAGTKKLQYQIENAHTYLEIRKTWQKDLIAFKKIRSKYLIYE
ncbi:MAG: DUF1343 domain-containing protein [Flavobacteriaceae bacterium]|nr:DUF1343 domain-containing protein [Flavobacteriaceae bacterium]